MIVSIIICVLVFISFFFVCGLMAFHTYLITNGRSTYEQFSSRYLYQSPFDRGYKINWLKTFWNVFNLSKQELKLDASSRCRRNDHRKYAPHLSLHLETINDHRIKCSHSAILDATRTSYRNEQELCLST